MGDTEINERSYIWFNRNSTLEENKRISSLVTYSFNNYMGGLLTKVGECVWKGGEREKIHDYYEKEIGRIIEPFSLEFDISNLRVWFHSYSGQSYCKDKEQEISEWRRHHLVFKEILQKPGFRIHGNLIPKTFPNSIIEILKLLKSAGYRGEIFEFEKPKSQKERSQKRSKSEKSRSKFQDEKDAAMKDVGYGMEPDWEAYDRACRKEEDEYSGSGIY